MNEKDEELYKRYLERRKEEDFRILFLRHREELLLFLYGYVHSLENAEELMMDTFVAVAALRSVFRGRSQFKTWLFAVAQKQAFQALRKRRFVPLPLRESVPDGSDPPETALLKDERNHQLYLAMERLKPEYREALYLLYFENMSNEEIQGVTGKSAKQVYNLINRGRAALREKLEGMGFDDA